MSKFTKMLIFKTQILLKKLPTSNLADRNIGSNKILLRIPSCPSRLENKNSYGSLKLLNIFKNVLQIMVEVLVLYKIKCAKRYGLAHNLVFLFPGGKWVAWISENFEYLRHYVTDFLHSFTICLGK